MQRLVQRVAIVVAVGLSLLTGNSPCRAWNSTGHEVAAQIAYDTMGAGSRATIVAILKHHPRLHEDLLDDAGDLAKGEDPDLAIFLRAATWPDMVRYIENPLQRTEDHPHWHYLDYPFELDGVVGKWPVEKWNGAGDPANLLQAMQKLRTDLKNPATALSRKAIDLCWVEHLVGDVHQPLHTASLFSRQYPMGDQGGNLQMVVSNAGVVMPLHMYWDNREGLSLEHDQIRGIADRIEREHPEAALKDRIGDGEVTAWAKESFELAKTAVYLNGALPHATREQAQRDPKSVPAITAKYDQDSLAVADARMGLAGYRLAKVLEAIAANQ